MIIEEVKNRPPSLIPHAKAKEVLAKLRKY